MQNKGLVKTLAILLALICVFYLSFSFVVAHYDKQAKEYAAGDAAKEYFYVDSIATKKVWFGYTLKECREKQLNLGLDLKGGMNVIMEVSVPDILQALSGYNTSETFTRSPFLPIFFTSCSKMISIRYLLPRSSDRSSLSSVPSHR